VKKSIKYIIQTLTKGEFDVMANELEFKADSKYKPILLDLEDGRKVEITGKIDKEIF
jgi:ATP-dependent helicase/DNAse subunit B